jgi:hypothetical protein
VLPSGGFPAGLGGKYRFACPAAVPAGTHGRGSSPWAWGSGPGPRRDLWCRGLYLVALAALAGGALATERDLCHTRGIVRRFGALHVAAGALVLASIPKLLLGLPLPAVGVAAALLLQGFIEPRAVRPHRAGLMRAVADELGPGAGLNGAPGPAGSQTAGAQAVRRQQVGHTPACASTAASLASARSLVLDRVHLVTGWSGRRVDKLRSG